MARRDDATQPRELPFEIEECADPECEARVCGICGQCIRPESHPVLWEGKFGMAICGSCKLDLQKG